jgi:hypothetical protein
MIVAEIGYQPGGKDSVGFEKSIHKILIKAKCIELKITVYQRITNFHVFSRQ